MAADRLEYCFDQEMVEAQKCAAEENWKGFKEIIVKKQKFLEPFDLFGNTAIHAVARSGKSTLLEELMLMLDEPNRREALSKKNDEGNTLLHEAIFSKYVKMVDVIMKFGEELQIGKDQLLLELNSWKETPVFRAAKYGKLEMLKHIHNEICPLKANHFPPSEINDLRRHILHYPILHYCLIAFKFDVAIWLVKKVDKSLISQRHWIENESTGKKEEGFTCFQLLSKMPMAFRSTDTREMGMIKTLVYYLLLPDFGYELQLELNDAGKKGFKPTRDAESGHAHDEGYESVLELEDAGKNRFKSTRDTESGQADDEIEKPSKSIFSSLNYYIWNHVAEVFDCVKEILKQKKRHKFAEPVAELLVMHEKENPSCMYSYLRSGQALRLMPDFPSNVTDKRNKIKVKERVTEEEKTKKNINEQKSKEDQAKEDNYKSEIWRETPLFLAAASGIIEVVQLIVKNYPEAISHVNDDGLNILHMAIKHRQLEIYEFIKESPAFKALISRISKKGRTILHQAARMDYYREPVLSGVAYQLQDELEWYHRVESIVPEHYLMHCDNEEDLTAGDLLDIKHAEMHDQAKQWMKETAQSCSTVAVLIAGVVFAAAYAIPGGNNEGGRPVLHNSPAFRIFTIMDVVALACSLGSVVMFLSILTSPFDLWDFHKSLPGKLRWGYIMLFCSLITTMLAFAATILLTIRMEGNNKRTTFIYSLAFVIVSGFGLTQFPIYRMFKKQFKDILFKQFKDMFKQCPKYWKKKLKYWKKK